ncbi:maestro heat-like repeat-containing protein family member 2B [Alligator mississippiensis]|uniref:Maestro heat-like repeat-containing protein family member 2B n=1 Tax=Alligator mississippiensis TaxID=8496 RepID=A0A151P4B4_ALLMI|nr:maestro heat-like repeat-containing protein family member 2B [Alligator mississippiensis]
MSSIWLGSEDPEKSKNCSSQAAEEKHSIQATCVEILENLDVSISGMSQVIGKYFPSNQALDFVGSIMDAMLSASPMCATAAGHWLITILRELGDALLDEVLDILGTIFIWMLTIQERSVKGFLLEGVSILAGFHLEAVTSSLLRKPLPMDRQHVRVWRRSPPFTPAQC